MPSSNQQGFPGLAVYIPRDPSVWSPRPRTVQDALDTLASKSAVGSAASFVWAEGGTAADGVYTSWATLYAAVSALPVETIKTIACDFSAATTPGEAPVPAGTYNVNGWQFEGAGARVGALIAMQAGAHWEWTTLRIGHDVFVQTNDGAAAVTTLTGGTAYFLEIDVQGGITNNGGAFLALDGATAYDVGIAMTSAELGGGDGVHPDTIIGTNALAVLGVAANVGSVIQAAAVDIAGTAQLEQDGSSTIIPTSQTATAGLTFVNLDPQPTYKFQPGGTGGGNVFTNWTLLMQAVSLSPGEKTILIDDSHGAAAMDVGAWNLDNCSLSYDWTAFASGGTGVLSIPIGTTLTWNRLTIRGGLNVTCDATAAVRTFSGATSFGLLMLLEESVLTCTSTGVFAATDTGAELFIYATQGPATSPWIGDGTHNVFSAAAGASVDLVGSGTNVAAHTFGGAGTLFAFLDASSILDATQDITTTTKHLVSDASRVNFTPTTAGNWNPQPATSADGLNQLAASNSKVAKGNTGTGTGTVTVDTAAITKAKNGTMKAHGSCALTTSGATTLTLQLVRDAVNIGTAKTLVCGAAVTGDFSIDAIDVAPDNAGHTYGLIVSASGGATITVAANSAQVQVIEDS